MNYKFSRWDMAFAHFLKFQLVAIALILSASCWSQSSKQVVSLNSQGKITVAGSITNAESFLFSIESLNFASEKEAITFFSNKKFDAIVIRPHFDSQVAHLYLNKSRYPNRTWEEWKRAISEETTQNPIKR